MTKSTQEWLAYAAIWAAVIALTALSVFVRHFQ